MGKPQLLANVATGARTGHGVKDIPWPEVSQQVLDEVTGTVAWVTSAPVVSGIRLVVEARKLRNGACVLWCAREFGKDRLVGPASSGGRPPVACSVTRR